MSNIKLCYGRNMPVPFKRFSFKNTGKTAFAIKYFVIQSPQFFVQLVYVCFTSPCTVFTVTALPMLSSGCTAATLPNCLPLLTLTERFVWWLIVAWSTFVSAIVSANISWITFVKNAVWGFKTVALAMTGFTWLV